MSRSRIHISPETLEDFCRMHRIRRLSLFGSVLRDDFSPESDVDVLVEFEPGVRVGLMGLAGIETDLSERLGRKVDLCTPGFFRAGLREKVLAEAEVVRDAA